MNTVPFPNQLQAVHKASAELFNHELRTTTGTIVGVVLIGLDADEIVRRWNMHDELVAALEEARIALATAAPTHGHYEAPRERHAAALNRVTKAVNEARAS